jgi:hypothetical protein
MAIMMHLTAKHTPHHLAKSALALKFRVLSIRALQKNTDMEVMMT